jgi:hypothetical protein
MTLPRAHFLFSSPTTLGEKIKNFEFTKAKRAEFFRKFGLTADNYKVEIQKWDEGDERLEEALQLHGIDYETYEDWETQTMINWLTFNTSTPEQDALELRGLLDEAKDLKKRVAEYESDATVRRFCDQA